MKHFSKVILFVLVISCAVCTAFLYHANNVINADNYTVIYVKYGGTGDGSSPSQAIDTITGAINKLGNDNGIIVLCGTVTIGEYAEPSHRGHIIITSLHNGVDYRETADAVFSLGNKYILGGAVTFENMNIETDGTTRLFFGNGHPIEFGEGVECTVTKKNGTYPYVFGGNNSRSGTLRGASVRINSGHFSKVSGGNRYVGGTINGDVSVTVNGGIVDTYINGSGVGTVNGNVTVTVNGGEVDHGVYGIDATSDRATTVTGDVTLNINGGDIGGNVAAAKNDRYATHNGTFTCYINTGELDSVTEIRGGMNVAGNNTSKIVYSEDIDVTEKPDGEISYTNPLTSGADPWVIYQNGYYYMVIVRGASITIAKALTVAGLGDAEPVAVWTATEATGVDSSIWSPELHYFSAEDFGQEQAGWYLYFACPPAEHPGDNFYRRSYALKALSDDPMGAWGSPVDGTPGVAERIVIDSDNTSWNIGPSIFRINGKIYMTWTGRTIKFYGEHKQSLNIAEMTSPYSIDISTKAIICEPTESWEKQGATYSTTTEKNLPEVVEGATAVYGDNGEVWCIYSASGYWTDSYALAQLKFIGGDPCDASNWVKSKSPIFVQNNEVYGPGHASYTKGHDGKNYFIYHGYLEPRSVSGRARYVFVEEFTFSDGNVILGSGRPKSLSSVISVANTPLSIKNRTTGFVSRVYVSSNGNDEYDGSTPNRAVATLDRAFALIPDGGEIIFVGTSYTIEKNYSTPTSDGKYLLTSMLKGTDGKAGVVSYSGILSLNSDFLIEDIRFKGSSTPIIACNGHNVTFGKNIKNDANSYIVGGANLAADDDAEKGNLTESYTITVESGVWVSIFGGNRRASGTSPISTISGDINIIIDGATFKISTTDISVNQNSVSGMGSTTGDLNLTVKSGEFYSGIFAVGRLGTSEGRAEHKGNISIRLLGGKFNVTGNGAYNAIIDACQQSDDTFDGNYYIEISDDVTVGYKNIGASGILGTATINASDSVTENATGFDRIMSSPYPLGDVDGDGNITNADITLLIRVLSGWEASYSEKNADLDKNARLTNRDGVLLITKLSAWN